ncbi:MAG: metallophosphoesterase [Anaerovoracaceae bacterium]|jgi:predicted phosphohydrolase
MSIYAIGDLHLSFDKRIQKPMDIFGPLWEDHAERLKENWLREVGEEDTVLIPGDISWGLRMDEATADFNWIHSLPGRKIITKGNHDLWWGSITKMNELYDDILFLQNRSVRIPEEGVTVCGTRGWICPGVEGFDEHDQKIYDRELIRLRFSLEDAKKQGGGEIIAMLHYPPTNDRMQGSGFTDMLEEFGVRTCIYGHLHGKDTFRHGLKGVLNGVHYHLVSLDYLEAVPLKLK